MHAVTNRCVGDPRTEGLRPAPSAPLRCSGHVRRRLCYVRPAAWATAQLPMGTAHVMCPRLLRMPPPRPRHRRRSAAYPRGSHLLVATALGNPAPPFLYPRLSPSWRPGAPVGRRGPPIRRPVMGFAAERERVRTEAAAPVWGGPLTPRRGPTGRALEERAVGDAAGGEGRATVVEGRGVVRRGVARGARAKR